jgi:hypothetical protein
MMEIQLEQWANGILKDTRKQWEGLKEQCDTLKDGFAVFYSSPRINPDLMVIGYNPAGNKKTLDSIQSVSRPYQALLTMSIFRTTISWQEK